MAAFFQKAFQLPGSRSQTGLESQFHAGGIRKKGFTAVSRREDGGRQALQAARRYLQPPQLQLDALLPGPEEQLRLPEGDAALLRHVQRLRRADAGAFIPPAASRRAGASGLKTAMGSLTAPPSVPPAA